MKTVKKKVAKPKRGSKLVAKFSDITQQQKVFMLRAIAVAKQGLRRGEGGPFGAVVVKNGVIIAEGNNQVTSRNDPTAHAEVVAIRRACEALGTFQLDDCEIYASCEPCPMCLGAIYWARPRKIFFAASRVDAASAGFDDEFIYREIVLPIARRRIKTMKVKLSEALEPFADWRSFTKKINY